jgi:superfamily II DNA/RNA helicase
VRVVGVEHNFVKMAESERSCIHGFQFKVGRCARGRSKGRALTLLGRDQARALAAQLGETERNHFLVGSLGPQQENEAGVQAPVGARAR